MATDKDTIYIDIDDEITGVIDKLTNSNGKVVALVLPKRAAVFQSVVNMKLLKRAADSSKKNLVLITSEAGLIPLAGLAGIHVAKTLTSKPEIPPAPKDFDDEEESIDEDGTDAEELPADPDKSVGELAGAAAGGALAADAVETLVLDDDDVAPEDDITPKPKTFDPPKGKKNKKLAVPDFDRFRLLLIGGGIALILLIIGAVFANTVLPKATITILTDATKVDTNVNLNLSTTATELNTKDNTVPAKLASVPKTYTQTVPTTGQKNNGNKASGTVTISLSNCSTNSVTIPAGTGLSSNNQTYITGESITLTSVTVGGNCNPNAFSNLWSQSTNVIAQNGGASFNISSGTSLIVSGFGNTKAKASSAITGGTDSIVQSVNQNDINSAKAKIVVNDAEIKKILTDQLKAAKYYPIEATYTASTPVTTTSAKVGDAANTVTVNEAVTYTMFGVKKEDLNTLLNNDIKGQIDTEKQSILDNGLSSATFNVTTLTATGGQITMTTSATAGPDLDVNTIREQAAGKKAGAIKEQLSGNPDVKSVNVKFSPFWVSTAPKKTERIIVDIAKPTSTAKSSSSDGSN
ncbi:MAG: hypothetical protein AAB436_02400 [Patescibacteria group bacterium]